MVFSACYILAFFTDVATRRLFRTAEQEAKTTTSATHSSMARTNHGKQAVFDNDVMSWLRSLPADDGTAQWSSGLTEKIIAAVDSVRELERIAQQPDDDI